MLGLAKTALAIILTWLLGAFLLGALGLRRRRWPLQYAQPALDFAVGCGVLATVYTVTAPVGWRVPRELLYVLLAVLAVAAGWRSLEHHFREREDVEEVPPSTRWAPRVSVLLIILLAVVALGVAANAYMTTMFWDGRYIWAFKAKAIFLDRTLDRETFTSLARYRYTHLDYPLALPAAEATIYQFLGHVDERRAKLIGVVFWLGTAALLAAYLRRRMALPWALGLTLLACQVPFIAYHAASGGADVPQAFCFLAAAVLLADWAERGRQEDCLLAALMFGVGALMKAEGLTMALGGALVFAAVWWARGRRVNARVAVLGPAALLLPYLPWAVLRSSWSIRALQLARMRLHPWPELWSRVVAVARSLATRFGDWQQWELTWVFVALGLLAYALSARRHRALAPLWALLLWQAAAYGAVYVLSTYRIGWHLDTSLDRVLLHLAPLAVAAAGSSIAACGVPEAGAAPAPAETGPRREVSSL